MCQSLISFRSRDNDRERRRQHKKWARRLNLSHFEKSIAEIIRLHVHWAGGFASVPGKSPDIVPPIKLAWNMLDDARADQAAA
jgi:hypothetical protein